MTFCGKVGRWGGDAVPAGRADKFEHGQEEQNNQTIINEQKIIKTRSAEFKHKQSTSRAAGRWIFRKQEIGYKNLLAHAFFGWTAEIYLYRLLPSPWVSKKDPDVPRAN